MWNVHGETDNKKHLKLHNVPLQLALWRKVNPGREVQRAREDGGTRSGS